MYRLKHPSLRKSLSPLTGIRQALRAAPAARRLRAGWKQIRPYTPARWPLLLAGLALFSGMMFAPADISDAAEAKQVGGTRVYLSEVFRFFSDQPWLGRINSYRAGSDLPAIANAPEWSVGAANHARYNVKTDTLEASEDNFSPYYTPEGNIAAGYSLQLVQPTTNFSDDQAIDFWLRSPFQALSILDPQWSEAGFGSFREPGGLHQMSAVLDVRRGFNETPSVTYPIYWPANGKGTRLRAYSGADAPNPQTHPGCAGYIGLPIILQVGNGSASVALTSNNPTLLRAGTSPQEHCVFTESTFLVPGDDDSTRYGRELLNQRDAIVILPRLALNPGTTYSVSIDAIVDGITRNYTWSFSILSD
jgi:hypothetical protein